MTRRLLVPTTVAFGVGLIVLGSSWKWLFPAAAYWSEQQAEEYVAAFKEVHAAQDAGLHGGSHDHSRDGTDLAAARQRYLKIRGELEKAQLARDRSGTSLTVVGLVMLLGAVLLRHYWVQPADEKRG